MKLWIGILCSVSAMWAGDTSTARIQESATKAVALIQKSQKNWYTKQSCFSCHQQVFPALAFRFAREHGIAVDEPAAHADAAAAFGFYSNFERAVEYTHVIDPALSDGYGMIAANSAGVRPSLVTAVYARLLAARQEADGHWETIDERPPQSYSPFTATAITATHLYLGYIDSCTQTARGVPGCFTGNAGSLSVTARLQQYVPDWVQPTLSTAPSGRCCSGIAYDAAHYYTLLFGGGDSGQPNPNPQNDTWIWRSGWYKLSPATSPSPRNGTNLAYNPTTGTVVLFGGADANGNFLNDTWTWDGVTWTQQFPPISPPGRQLNVPAMAYDAATGTVVLFGGSAQGGDLGDTWEWNGRTKTWTQLFPATSPSPREAPLAYDPITREIVLFGGNGSTGDLNDTWTWNGATWTQRFPAASPSPRYISSIAYDAGLGQVVLFGGRAPDGQSLDDTWGWNGATWTQLKTYSRPAARYAAPMDFDPLSNGLVFFAGWTQCCTPNDDTWLLVPVPVP
jgi:hypothetical protein